ncbi:MAG: patatin-like phospholipase family protein [Acidobacteriota bacterium]
MADLFSSTSLGLALSGGGPRGLAHIGVIKALDTYGLRPSFIAGTSAGSIVGAMLAAGMNWHEMRAIAASIFWPDLFDGKNLERFCARYLPATFAELQYPFVAIAGEWPSRQMVVLGEGDLPSAISASCALPGVRRPVLREGLALLDGGIACPLPAEPVRKLGATHVIASDVLGISSVLRAIGIELTTPSVRRFFPAHYRQALDATDILIAPSIPLIGMLPIGSGLDAIIAAGEATAHAALNHQRQQWLQLLLNGS